MVRKTSDFIASPPVMPAFVREYANKDAIDAATMPRGAIQDKKNCCFQLKLRFQVDSRMLMGRTMSISVSTVKTPPQPKSRMLAIDKSAANKINSTEFAR